MSAKDSSRKILADPTDASFLPPPGPARSGKIRPVPFYGCGLCYDPTTFPVEMLYWSEPLRNFRCPLCWDKYEQHRLPDGTLIPYGISLEEELNRLAPDQQQHELLPGANDTH